MPVSDLWRAALRAVPADAPGVSDADLLARFRDARDPAAFELLVYRHGPLVWAACRRLLADAHAAEDAFQATFLALARRAGGIRRGRSVAGWLHRVAVRASLDLRRRRPCGLADRDHPDPGPGPADRAAAADMARHVDAAIDRLPGRLRRAVVLCHLHGYSLKEAAAELGCPVGTVESRLARGRCRLRGLLAGLAPGAAVPRALRAATLRAATGGTPVPPAVTALAARAAGGSGLTVPGLAAALAAAVLAAVGFGQADPPAPTPKAPPAPAKAVPTPKARADADGLPLPDGAVARLGSSRFRHAGYPVAPVAFSADGKRVASANAHGVDVFDTATGRAAFRLHLPAEQRPRAVRFLADGTRLAVGSADWQRAAALTVYDLADGKVLATTKFDGKGQIFVIDITPDGGRVLVEDRFHKVFLWDVAANKELWAFDHPEASFTLPLTADGKRLVLALNRKAEVRNAATGKVVGTLPHPGPPFGALYSGSAVAPDGRLGVVSEDGAMVAVLDAGGGGVRTWKADRRLTNLAFSPDGRHLAGFGEFGTRVWDLTAPTDTGPVAKLPAAWNAGFSPDGKTLALDDLGFLTLWSVGDWKPAAAADPPSAVRHVRFSADGKRVYGLTRGGWVSWPAGGGPANRLSDDAEIHREGMGDVTPDGRVAVDVLHEPGPGRAPGKTALRVTDLTTEKARRIPLDREPWDPVRVTPDGRFVSASLQGSEFGVWDARTGDRLLTEKRSDGGHIILGIDPTPDGKGVARSVVGVWSEQGGRDPLAPAYREVVVTDHRSGREWKLDPVPWSIYSGGVRFSPDGSRLVVQGHFDRDWKRDGAAVWDVRTGRHLLTLTRKTGRIDATTLSADGRSLLIGHEDGKLALVELATGGERVAFRHGGQVLSAVFSVDGTRAVASSPEAPVYVWDLLGEPDRWDPAKADAVWADLASTDARTAFAAIRKLRANPAEAVAFLKERVKLSSAPADGEVAGLLKQLDAPAFADRERAERALTEAAELVRPKLEAARKGASAEAGPRLDRALKAADGWTPERLRQVRACEVLEGIGSPEAVRVLRSWATGPAGARLTVEAQESLGRLPDR